MSRSSPTAPENAQSVSDLARQVRSVLDGSFESVWVKGELSNYRAYGSGHWYFTLKDEEAQLKAAMFGRDNRKVRFTPQDGDEILVRGRVDLYTRRGDLQIVVDHMEPLGAGRLHQEFERLKSRLGGEGLFDADRKKALPAVPRRIGIVTSEKAAALQDMLRVLSMRDETLAITLAPARVQGDGAAATIAAALDLLNRASDVEVILCGRGGGSMEDLWAFNEEIVARAIARSRIPVVSGVGHEIDFTIADFVADARAPTPTAAAEMAVPIRRDLEAMVTDRLQRLVGAQERFLTRRAQRVDELSARLQSSSPRRRLSQRAQRLEDATQRLQGAMQRGHVLRQSRASTALQRLEAASPARRLVSLHQRVQHSRQRLGRAGYVSMVGRRERLETGRRALGLLGPLQSLGRGYSIATAEEDGRVLRSAQGSRVGDLLRLRLAQGALRCKVEEVLSDEDLDLRGRVRK